MTLRLLLLLQNLAAQKNYNKLNMTMREALASRACCMEGVLKCYRHETLETVIDRIAKAEVGGACSPGHAPGHFLPIDSPSKSNKCSECVAVVASQHLQVHRLVLVDSHDVVRGIVSLSDLLQALVLSPAGIDALYS